MTKPLTSVAAMMLYEQGGLPLRQPIAEILPEFADARVYQLGSALNPGTVPAEPIRVWHLLTHTSGMTYGFLHQHPMDEMHRLMDVEFFPPERLHPRRRRAAVGQGAAAVPAGHRVELRRVHRRARPGGRGRLRDAARPVLRRAHHRPARHGRHRVHRAGGEGRPVRRPVRRGRRPARPRSARTTSPPTRAARSRSSPAAAGWSPPLPTTCASPGCCWAAASWTGCGCSAAGRWTT